MRNRFIRPSLAIVVAIALTAALTPNVNAAPTSAPQAAVALASKSKPRGEVSWRANVCHTGKSARFKRTMNTIRAKDQLEKPAPPNIAKPIPDLPGALGAITTPSGIKAYGSGAFRATQRGNVASVTKSFTAAIVLQLAQEGKISLNQKIYKWRKQINWRGSKKVLKKISVKRVLDHTSGIPELMKTPQVLPNANNPKFNPSPRQLVGWASKMPMNFAPGTSWSYSNTDYEILGIIIESITKRSYESNLRNRLFKPLGLKNTSLVRGKPKRTAQGYYLTARQPATNPMRVKWTKLAANANSQMRWAWAAGGIQSTSCDLTKWVSALLNSNKVLNANYRKKMQTVTPKSVPIAKALLPGWIGYGLGLMRISLDGTKAWGHLGNIPGFASGALYVKSKRVSTSVILPSGAAGAVPAMTRLINTRR